ncbi:MAG TPA: Nramp family divalent metal transporter [Cyclobacteriaceae bacterium]|nr:Nramp family divalent metal transporter [Cyclobacteriaceae bacterium]
MQNNIPQTKSGIFTKAWHILLAVGPGIFAVGYTIGTGSVTSMAKAGADYGMKLLWVLTLSVIFSWLLMEAYGRYAVITGESSIYAIRNRLKYGKVWAILIIVGVVAAQWSSLIGIMGLSSKMIYEVIRIFIPGLNESDYWMVLVIAIVLIAILYALLLVGEYSFFEKVLIVLVVIMGISFIISMFIVLPPPGEIVEGFIPVIPEGGTMLVAAFVGTTMASPTFVVRPLIVKEKGWGPGNTREQSRDAITSALLMFIISGSIMVAACGAMFHEGKTVTKVLDMAYSLEPFAGKFAVAIFIFGALSAGISSIFPILMVAPLLIGDYRSGKMDIKSGMFRGLTAFACIVGLAVPVLDTNPILAQIATQIAGVFVLPLVILGILFLINRKELMGDHKPGIVFNIGLVAALVFALIISYNGALALKDYLF